MKYIFSTSFDDTTYNTSTYPSIGIKGLLSLLERELGLYRSFPSNQIRLKCYLESLSEYKKNVFFTDSVNKNKYQVAQKLMSYRDTLVSLGWHREMTTQPERLQAFSEVEKLFQSKGSDYIGEADRWNFVLEQLMPEKVSQLYIEEIQLRDPVEFLPSFLRKVFDRLNDITVYNDDSKKLNLVENNLSVFKNAITSSYTGSTIVNSRTLKSFEEDKSLILLQFNSIQELNDAMAFWADASEHLFLCKDNVDFDYSLLSFHKVASGSNQKNAQPQIIQLFKLVLPAITGAFNSNTFLSFLQLKYSPLPFNLKRKLLKCFTEQPGIGNEQWNEVISEFVNNADPKNTKENTLIVDLFLQFGKLDAEKSIQKAKSILSYLSKWSMKMVGGFGENSLQEQFLYIHQMCEDTLALINEEQDLTNVIKAFNQIYNPKTFLNYTKQVGSTDCLTDYNMISSNCNKTVVQLDFYGNPSPQNSAQFLLEEEIIFLKANSAYYMDYPKLYFNQLLRGLSHIDKQLILCYVEKNEIEKHPFHIRLDILFKDYSDKIVLKVTTPEDLKNIDPEFFEKGVLSENRPIELPQVAAYLSLDVAQQFEKRIVESASSIEKLIHYPFEWIVNYVLKLKPTRIASIPEGNQLKGNIAHKITENLLNEAKARNIYPIVILDKTLEKEFQKVIEQEGMYFLQEENRFDLSLFKKQFLVSFENLISLINDNNFSIIACEQPLSSHGVCYLPSLDLNVTGFIDLVLQDQNGKPFIIDMKWTYSDKKYKEKLTNEEAIQLSLYAAALQYLDGNTIGYYLFNQNKFLSTAELKGKNIELVNCDFSNAVVLEKIKQSLAIRWSEFEQGQIEIGDGFSLDDLGYHLSGRKIELPKDGKTKKNEVYSDLKLFKGQLN